MNYVELFSKENLSSLPHLFISSITISISLDSWTCILLGYHLFLCSSFCRSTSSRFGRGARLAPGSDTPHPILLFVLSISLPSIPTECSRLILYFPCLSPGIRHFPKESWVLSLDNGA